MDFSSDIICGNNNWKIIDNDKKKLKKYSSDNFNQSIKKSNQLVEVVAKTKF